MSDHFGNIPIELPKTTTPSGKDKKPVAGPPSAKIPEGKGRKTRFKPGRMWFWLAFVAVLFGLYNAVGFLGIPYYITRTLPASFQKATGMILDPGRISFNPYNFHFETENVKILTEAGPTLLSLKKITADLAPLSLLRRDLVCNTILIEEIDLNVTRELDGSYNLDQLLRREQDSKTSEIMDFSDLPFFFSLNNIAIRNSRVLFNDLPAGKTHTINTIQLDLPALSNIPFRADRYIHPRFSAVINGSPVELTGQAHVGEPGGPGLATNLSCNLLDLDLPIYSEYLPVDLPFIFKKGKADGKLDFHFNPDAKEDDKLSIGFDLQISETELQTPDGSVLIAAPSAELKGKLQPVAKMLLFTDIALREPAVNSFGDSFLGNINKLIKREKGSRSADADSASPLSLATDSLILDNGLFRHYKNHEDKKPVMTWKALQLNVKNYSTVATGEKNNDFGSFRLSGEKEGAASLFSWQGTFSSPENLHGSLNLIKMDFQELLEAFGTEKQFTVQGTADLKGELAFPSSTDSAATTGYKLTDGELSVQNFKLLENKQAVLSTPLLQATNLSTAGSAINWGTIALQNGLAIFSAGKTPKYFSQFNTDKNRMQGLDLEGQVTLIPKEKDKQKIQLINISLKASNLETPEKSRDNFTFTAQTATGGSLSCKGDIRIAPFALAVASDFSGLAAEDVFPLFTDSDLLNSLSGALAGSGTLTLPRQSYAGELRLAKAYVRKSGKTLYAWEDSVFQGVNYTSEPLHLGIALAAIEQPEYIWQIGKKDGDPMQQLASFFQQHLPKAGKQTGEKGKVAISPVDIQEIRINKANIRIQDNRTKPKWQGQLTDFTGNIKNIHMSSAAPASDFAFIGILDETPVSILGSIDVFAKEQHGKFRATLENYPLASFHKQLSAQSDIDTSDGTFSMTLDAMWQDGQFRNSGSLIFSQVKPVSEKADSALALALLTGPEDTFQLDFDLLRNQPAGKTVLAEDILASLETKIVKASVSPLLLASGDFSDLIGIEFAEFQPGEIKLSDNGRETLTRYSALLLSHPYLGLLLSGGADKQADGEAMKKQLEAAELQRIDELNRKRLDDWQKRKAAYERKLQEQPKNAGSDGKFVEANLPPDILAGFTPVQPEPVIVKDSMLLELAQKRQSVVFEFFTTQLGLEADRISLASPKRMADVQSDVSETGVKIGLRAIKR
jgi:hypothetical protein